MKKISHYIMKVVMLCACLSLGGHLMEAAEMNADVGIEFTEIEPEPKPKPEPEPSAPTPEPIPKKPIVKLPQTGEASNKSSLLAGGSLLIGSGLLMFGRRKEVDEK